MQPATQTPALPLRERVLDAAERVVQLKGAAHLTIDAVVSEANVSKGGLLYHFKSKEALVTGLLERTLDHYRERIDRFQKLHPDEDQKGVVELLAVTEGELADRSIGLSLLTAATQNPALMEPARTLLAESLTQVERLEAEIPTARLLFISMIGMHLLDVLKLLPFSDEEKSQLRERARDALKQ